MKISIVQSLMSKELYSPIRDLGEKIRGIQFPETREERGAVGDCGRNCPVTQEIRGMERITAPDKALTK